MALLAAAVVGFVLLFSPNARTPARYMAIVWLTLEGVAQAAVTPSGYHAINQALGYNNIAIVICHSLGLAALFFLLMMYMFWRLEGGYRAALRKRAPVMAAAIIALNVLFFATPEVPEILDSWRLANAGRPTVAWYSIVLGAAIAWTMFEAGRLSLVYLRRVPSWYHRVGLSMVAFGGCLGSALFALLGIVDGLAGLAGATLPPHTGLNRLLVLLAVAGFSLGLLVPGTIGGTVEVIRRSRQAELCRRMEPLYRALTQQYPEVLKRRPRYGGIGWIVNWWGNGRRLNERTIEVLDALVALRPRMDRLAADTAAALAERHGLPDDQIRVIAQATQIADALRATETERRTGDSTVPMTQQGEAPWLVRVSRAFAGSPLVAQALAEVAQRRAEDPAHA